MRRENCESGHENSEEQNLIDEIFLETEYAEKVGLSQRGVTSERNFAVFYCRGFLDRGVFLETSATAVKTVAEAVIGSGASS